MYYAYIYIYIHDQIYTYMQYLSLSADFLSRSGMLPAQAEAEAASIKATNKAYCKQYKAGPRERCISCGYHGYHGYLTQRIRRKPMNMWI